MATITFDAHKFVRRYRAGLEENQARAITGAKEALGEAELATKRDIERLEARFERLETKLSGEMTLLKWMLGILLGSVIGLVMKAGLNGFDGRRRAASVQGADCVSDRG